jgi:hypothetical protein
MALILILRRGNMEKGLPNFLHLFERIQNYLAKVPNVTPQELADAKKAYNTIIEIIYGPEEGIGAPCVSGHIKFIAFHK